MDESCKLIITLAKMKLVDLLFKIAGLSVKLIFLKNQNKKIIILNSFCCFWHEPVHSQMKQKTKQNKQTHFQSKMKALAKLSKEVFFFHTDTWELFLHNFVI